jgi:ABC-type antimicrobial peptide transport system permease subunit
MGMLTNLPASMGMLVYYPWWLGIITLIGIIFITVICGQMPIRSLLRRSPAEILAKYDI